MTPLQERYSRYSDSHLAGVLLHPNNYTPEAIEAAKFEAETRGGEEEVIGRARQAAEHNEAVEKYRKHVRKQLAAGATPEQLVAAASSFGLTVEEVREIIEEKHEEHVEEVRQTTETPRSAIMSVVGAAVSVIPGTIYCATLVFGGRAIFFALLIGLLGMCYGITYLFAGRKSTIMVWVMSMTATVISIWLGWELAMAGVFQTGVHG